MKKLVAAATVLFCVCPMSGQTRTNTVLRTAAELRRLSETEAKAGMSFDLTAQVLQKHTGITGCAFFVSDDSGGIILYAEDNPQSFTYSPGDIVRWRGVTDINIDHELYAKCNATETVGRKPIPPVTTADPEMIPRGKYDYMRVSVKGYVTLAFRDEIDPRCQYLALNAGECTIYASISERSHQRMKLSKLIGAEIVATGICTPNGSGRRIFLGHRLSISGPDDIRILRHPPEDPFSVPHIDNPRHVRAAEISKIGRRRIDGTVLAIWGGNVMMIRTKSGNAVKVELADGELPPCGSNIAAVGLPATDLFHINLMQAVWKPLPDTKENFTAEPKDVTVQSLLFNELGERKFNPRQQGTLFRITGNVRSLSPPNDPAARMLLSCDDNIIPVDASSCPTALDGLEINSVVSVIGVCVFDVQNWNPNVVFPRIKGLTLVLRRPGDVEIISRPPWWTPAKLLVVIGSLFAALVGFVIWNRTLNRIVERRSRQLARERIARDGAELRIAERTRLAVEIHDALSQTLTGVSFQIDAAEQARRQDPSRIKNFLDIARQTLLSCRKDLRNCLWDLRNNALEESDAALAIRRTVEPHIGDAELSVNFEVSRRKLPDNAFHAVLCIVRELAVNASLHGTARHISVRGRLEGDILTIEVKDDGIGFDPLHHPGVGEGHFGLLGVSERAESFKGQVDIISSPGLGATVCVTLHTRST